MMTASTASAWIAVAAFAERLVAQLSTLSKADEERMAFGLTDKLNDLVDSKAPMGRAEWEVLLLQKQVISQVCRACMQGLGSRPTSEATSTVLMMLATLLTKAVTQVNAASDASNTDLHAAVCDQLTQSGLLQQLPGAMHATARLLAETAAQHHLSSSSGSTSNRTCGSGTHSTSTSSCSSNGHRGASALSYVLDQARSVLDVYTVLHSVWAPGLAKLRALASAAEPAVELIMASVHAVDQLLQQQQQLQQPLRGFDLIAAHVMLPSVQQSLVQLVLSLDYKEAGEGPFADTAAGRAVLEAALPLQAAKSSSQYLYCLSYSILVLSIASMPALQQLAADEQAAGSAEAPLDEVAASLLQQADSMQPELHHSQQQLAALLGLKPRMVLWAAAAAAVVPTINYGLSVLQGRTSMYLTTYLWAHQGLSQYLQTSATPQQLQTWAHQQQHWACDVGLLQWGMCTGLQWAASLPHQHSLSWCTAVAAADSAVQAWAAIEKASLLQGPTGSDRLAVLEQEFAQWTDCLLLPVLQLSAVICQHTQQLLLSRSSGSGSTASSSSIGGPARCYWASGAVPKGWAPRQADLSSLLSSLARMVRLQVSLVRGKGTDAEQMVQQDSTAAAAAGRPPSRPVGLPAAAAQHLMDLLQAWEGFTRCVAAACATPDLIQQQVARALADVSGLCTDRASPVLGAITAAGPRSSACRQLYSLMTSLVKVSKCCGVKDPTEPQGKLISTLLTASAGAALRCCTDGQCSPVGRCRHEHSLGGLSPPLHYDSTKPGSGWPHVQCLGTTAAARGTNTAAATSDGCCLKQLCA